MHVHCFSIPSISGGNLLRVCGCLLPRVVLWNSASRFLVRPKQKLCWKHLVIFTRLHVAYTLRHISCVLVFPTTSATRDSDGKGEVIEARSAKSGLYWRYIGASCVTSMGAVGSRWTNWISLRPFTVLIATHEKLIEQNAEAFGNACSSIRWDFAPTGARIATIASAPSQNSDFCGIPIIHRFRLSIFFACLAWFRAVV